ncbi:hypothetical protein BCR39DRAFT_562641 [Naematelia encephala]|uniref:Uncharacterized protein n=1 Tax=Naematelia encephala TaxID=71784 RepID=A0A1Y2AFS7_9TREE|nr:hypothetical protein BCR39DRAFT_562641 [Naematelia encephala]
MATSSTTPNAATGSVASSIQSDTLLASTQPAASLDTVSTYASEIERRTGITQAMQDSIEWKSPEYPSDGRKGLPTELWSMIFTDVATTERGERLADGSANEYRERALGRLRLVCTDWWYHVTFNLSRPRASTYWTGVKKLELSESLDGPDGESLNSRLKLVDKSNRYSAVNLRIGLDYGKTRFPYEDGDFKSVKTLLVDLKEGDNGQRSAFLKYTLPQILVDTGVATRIERICINFSDCGEMDDYDQACSKSLTELFAKCDSLNEFACIYTTMGQAKIKATPPRGTVVSIILTPSESVFMNSMQERLAEYSGGDEDQSRATLTLAWTHRSKYNTQGSLLAKTLQLTGEDDIGDLTEPQMTERLQAKRIEVVGSCSFTGSLPFRLYPYRQQFLPRTSTGWPSEPS